MATGFIFWWLGAIALERINLKFNGLLSEGSYAGGRGQKEPTLLIGWDWNKDVLYLAASSLGIIIYFYWALKLDSDSERLWSKLEAQPVSLQQEIELPQTSKRAARKAKLAVRFCPVNLRTPYRFDNRDPLPVYAVYATEVDYPEGETPVEWMLLTT